jgi:hypothetical protein
MRIAMVVVYGLSLGCQHDAAPASPAPAAHDELADMAKAICACGDMVCAKDVEKRWAKLDDKLREDAQLTDAEKKTVADIHDCLTEILARDTPPEGGSEAL